MNEAKGAQASTPRFGAADLRPQGAFEMALNAGQSLPGTVGWICYRKLKRRIANRSLHQFDQLLARLGPGDIAIDLGANAGEITIPLAETGATVHAFEPDPETAARLRKNLGDRPNVTVHLAAVADYDGTARLARPVSYAEKPESASKASSIMRHDAPMDRENAFDVEVIDFARFLQSLDRPARLVKVDIEGAEWPLLEQVMNGPALDCFEAMFVETHERFDLSVLPLARRLQAQAEKLERPYINLYWK